MSGGHTVECGFVVVPEDHEDLESPTIKLAVAVFKDESDAHLPDPVILLAGGPGEKIVHNAPGIAQVFASVHANRDLIVFDQRGTGLSEPALECPELVQLMFDLLGEPDPEIAAKAGFDAILACRDRLVSEGHNLSAYNTVQNAADVEAIRIALGYDQLNLYGGSYGSLLAQAVMRDHPKHIRSVVIESVFPLEVSFFVDTTATVSDAIMQLLDHCAADDACANAYPDLQEILFEIIDRLNAEPVAITVTNPLDGESYDTWLTGDEVLVNLRVVLYLTPTIPAVPQAIYDVYNDDYELMINLTGLRFIFADTISRGLMYSVMCTEDLVGRTPDEIINLRAALPKQLAGSEDNDIFFEYGIFAICENWPVEQADPWVKEPLVSDIPTLVLSGELDPVTPPEFAKMVAENLRNSYLYTFPGAGHTGDNTSECALDITASFLKDPTMPPDGSCIADMQGLVFDLPVEEGAEVTFVPYTNEALGIIGVVPSGWAEVGPGIFARGSTVLDPAAFQLAAEQTSMEEMLDTITQSYGLDETPESTAERRANGLTWAIYAIDPQDYPREIAMAESDGVTLILILRSSIDERAALHETVFLPMVDALMRLK
jgi:pimeloyl-ACP methyl ester carboxylesterase